MSKALKDLKALKDQGEYVHTNPFEKKPKGIIFLLVGVSGAGKSTIVRIVANVKISIIKGINRVLKFIITHTTRNERDNPDFGKEIHGVHYFFVSVEEFVRLKLLGFFAEYEEVHTGKFYGTSYNELYEAATHYGYGITDIDINGAKALKDLFPKNIHIIFVRTQNKQQAIDQLRNRARKEGVSEEEIQKRIERFEYELEQMEKYADSKVTNVPGDIDHAVNCTKQIIAEKIKQVEDL